MLDKMSVKVSINAGYTIFCNLCIAHEKLGIAQSVVDEGRA